MNGRIDRSFLHTFLITACAVVLGLHGSARAQNRAQSPAATLNLSHDLTTLGIAGSNMTPNQPALDSRPLFNSAMAYVAGHPAITFVTADTGTYYFLTAPGVHASMSNLTNVNVDLAGSEFRFVDYKVFGMYIDHSTNTTFQNFSIDYITLPFTQVTVTGVDTLNGVVNYTPLAGWPSPTIYNGDSPNPGQPIVFQAFRSGKPASNLSPTATQLPFQADKITLPNQGAPWQTPGVLARILPGDIGVISNRLAQVALTCYICNGMTFQNIRIYSGGNAMTLSHTKNSLVKRVYVMPKPGTDRLMGVTSDGPSMDEAESNNTFLLDRSIRTMDDGFDPHALVLGTVNSLVNPTTLKIQMMFPWYVFPNEGNDAVAFYRPSDSAQLATANMVSKANAGAGLLNVQFDHDVSTVPLGSAMASTNPTYRGGGTLIDRCAILYQGFANGITLWGLINTTVRGTYIHQSASSAITIEHWLQINLGWLTPPAATISIQHNVIDQAISMVGDNIGNHQRWAAIQTLTIAPGNTWGTSTQFMTSSPLSNMSITDNFIADPSRTAIRLQGAAGGAIQGNTLLNPINRVHPDGWDIDTTEPWKTQIETPIVMLTSTGVVPSGNVLVKSPRRPLVTDTTFQHLAAYAPGSHIYLNAFQIGSLPSPAITMKDANGASWPLIVSTTAPNYLDVALPNPGGDITGGAYIIVQSGNTKLYGTLFIDTQDNIAALNGCVSFADRKTFHFSNAGGTGNVLVAGPGCGYSATTPDSFVTFNGPSAGSAPGTVSFTVGANGGGPRTATVNVAGDAIVITQDDNALFTDDPLAAAVTPVRLVHVTQLRTRIDAIRQRFGLGAFVYTHPSLTAGTSIVTAVDITEMRTALAQAYAATFLSAPAYSTSPAPGQVIAAADIAELRAAVLALEM